MIVGCYVLHLYCAQPNCPINGRELGRNEPVEFTAKNLTTAKQAARRAGWSFINRECWCPEHRRAVPRRTE